ncbi:hypothetical protein GGQ64_005350 [Rhizobium azooxidifex]|uniref:Uncharacterized protein n=1 Tax=Mycoplana azooxidifex TaxID=1636188 RepID=A0A7W6GMB6_9HYPH|nr:hypothetical protein [Mycoplana azooxidifex]MBB3980103.1 hypothetical protein [Mycoplana azooxidifex]
MAQPTKYNRAFNFANQQALTPATPVPANQVEAELNRVKRTTDEIIDNIGLIQRDDGALMNQTVGYDQLQPSLSVGFTLKGYWAAGSDYRTADGVVYDDKFYRAMVTHTSTTANRPDVDTATWEFLFSIADATIPPGSLDIGTVATDGSVTTGKLADGAVGAAKIADGAVGTDALATEGIFRPKLFSHFQRSIPLNMWELGARGSDNEDALVDDTVAIHAAFTQAISEGRELYIPGTNYKMDRYLNTSAARKRVYLSGDPMGRPIFHVPQAVADATGSAGRFIQIGRGNFSDAAGDVTGLALAENVIPGMRRIKLADVTGIRAGMVLTIASNRLWYYDDRGQYYCSEMHLISKVLEATDEVVIDDYTRDVYTIGVDTLYIKAWEPDTGEVNNIGILFPSSGPGAGTRGFMMDRTVNFRAHEVMIEGCTGPGALAITRAWLPRVDNYEVRGGGVELVGGSMGYGMSANSWYGGIVTGLKSRGMRRSIDFDTTSAAQNQSVTRDVIVTDFHITGGNATSGVGEIVQAPEFDSATGWTTSTPWAISGGKATRTGGTTGSLYAAISGFVPGETAYIVAVINSITGGGIRFGFFEDTTQLSVTSYITEPGTYTFPLAVPPSANRLYAQADTNGVSCELESLSLQAPSFFYPDGDAPNYGIGGHGAIEGIVFSKGFISDVQYAINVRNRDTVISDVNFRGRMEYCVYATHGTGLTVRDSNYRRTDFPDKMDSATAWDTTQTDKLPKAFVRLGISTGSGDWKYDGITRISNNDAHGLREAFLSLGITSTYSVKNLFVENDKVVIGAPAGTTFEFIKVEGGSGEARVGYSHIDLGSLHVSNYGAGTYRMLPPVAKFIIGSSGHWPTLDCAVQTGNRQWRFLLNDDLVIRIPNAAPQGERLGVKLIPNGGDGYGDFLVAPGSATLVDIGAIGPDVVGSASILTDGTSDGTDAKFNVFLDATTGDLYLKNRTGTGRRWIVELT